MVDRKSSTATSPLGPRTYLFLLIFAAGVSLLPTEAFAQTIWRNSTITWASGQRTFTNNLNTYDAQGRHSAALNTTFGNNNWQHIDIYACPWTSATPASSTTRPTGCLLVRTGTSTYINQRSANITWTPTQALLGNGATAIVSWVKSGSDANKIASVFLWNTYGIWLSRTTPLPLMEGTNATYNVRLSRGVSSNVVIRVSSNDATALTVNKAGGTAGSFQDLTFSSTNWNTAQAITAIAVEDVDSVSETVTLTHAVRDAQSHDTYDNVPDSTLTVNLNDNETGLSASTNSVTVQEESATGSTYTLMLASQPTGTVTVSLTVSGTPPPAAVAPTSLEFSATTWNTAQTVTVTAGHDDDADQETATVSHTAASSDSNYNYATARAAENVTVTVTDNDTAGLAVDPMALALTEEDATLGSGTYTLALATQPGGAVTVTATVPAGETAVTVGPAGSVRTRTLEFDATTWNTAQTVTVVAGHDDDAHGETVTLGHTAASGDGNYEFATARVAENVTVTVTDDDTAGLVVDPTALALTEEDATLGSGTYTLALATQPGGAVTVTATVPAGETAVTVGPVGSVRTRTLEFSVTTWNTAQTVTVTAGDDSDADGETVTVSHTAQAAQATVDAAYTFATARVAENVTVTVTDNDTPALVVSATGLTGDGVPEGTAEPYTVALRTEPVNGDVTVTVTVDDGNATVNTDPARPEARDLVFDATTWNTAQTVTVTAGEDDDGADGTVTLTHDPSGADYDTLATASLTFTVVDDDPRRVTLSGSTLTVTENLTAPYTVVLDTQPVGGPVTVTAESQDSAVATVDTDQSPASRDLVFTAGNWATAQTVLVAGVDDPNSSNDDVQVTHAVAGADYAANGVTAGAVTVTVTDDDVPGLRVDPTQLTVPENTAREYTVELTTAPSGAVTVTVGVTPAGKVEVDADPGTSGTQAELAFTTMTWNTARTVEVKGLEDDDGVNETRTLTHDVGGAAEYTGLMALRRPSVTVEVTDDDPVGVTVDTDPGTAGVQETPLAVKEDPAADGGTTAHEKPYTVVLDTEPTAPVTVTVDSSDADAVMRAPEILTFTATTWATAQTVTASAVADEDAVDETETLRHGLTGAMEYAAETVPDLTVTVEDDEEQGITLSGGTLTVAEDDEGTYGVVLTSAPVAPMVVRIASNNEDVHAMPGLLQFDENNWADTQAVTVRADGDADARTDEATLTHTAAGGDYTGQTAELMVAVTDGDARVVISRQAVTVLEGQRNSYTVRLGAAPAGNVTVAVTSTDATKATAGPATLVFGRTTWATPQGVAVTGVAAGSATLRHAVSGYGTVTTAANVAATVVGPTEILVVDPRTFHLLEGTDGTYTVRLARNPGGAVTVRVSTGDGLTNPDPSDLFRRNADLSFDTSNWATPQPVTISSPRRLNAWSGGDRFTHTVEGALSAPSGSTPVEVWEILDTRPLLETAVADQTVRVGQEVNVQLGAGVQDVVAGPGTPRTTNGRVLTATDTGHSGDSRRERVDLRYTLTPAIPGLTLDPTTRRLQGTPTQAAPAATYRLTVTDATGDSASLDFELTVEDNPLPGFVGSEGPQQHVLNRAVTQILPAPAVPMGETPSLRFVVAPALPPGLEYEPPTETMAPYTTGGRIVGTPTQTTPQRQYTLTVVDAGGNEATLRFLLGTGTPPPPPAPPPSVNPRPTFGAATVPAQVYRQGAAIPPLVLPAARGGDFPLGYALTPALPAGLTYTAPADTTSGGTVAGTPAAAQAETTYTLTATDADGDAATLAFTIAVEASSGVILPRDGTRTVTIYGHQVTVTQAPGTLAGVELTLPETLAQAVTITLAPPGADVPLERGRYGFGPAGARAAVDVGVVPVPADGMDLCLPVPVGLRREAGARELRLLRYTGEEWVPVAGATDDAEAGRMCAAGVTAFGPLAVGYAHAVGVILPRDGTRTVTVYGHRVTVTQAPGTLAGVELTLPETLAQAVRITLAPPGADVPLERGRYGFGPAGARAAVDVGVVPVPADGMDLCLPVPAGLRTEAGTRAVRLVRYTGEEWVPVAGVADDAAAGRICAAGVTAFGPLAVGYENAVPRFEQPVAAQTFLVNEARSVRLPAATDGDGTLTYTLTPAALPAGLSYTPPADPAASGGVIAGTPTEGRPPTPYTLTATDADGDTDTVTFTIEVVRVPVRATVTDAAAVEGAAVEFPVTLSRAVSRPLTLQWTAGRPGSATPGEDYPAEAAGRLVLAAGTTAGTLRVPTLDDRRVEPTETFTVTVTLPDDPLIEIAEATATGRIEDDDTEQARRRSLGMVLAGVGRTLATDAVDVIGDRFLRQPSTTQATVGGQALNLNPQTGRWRQAAGVTYGVARALGVEVGSPLAGGDGQFGQVRGAAWSTLTRHLRDPHAAAAPLSAWDASSAFTTPAGIGPGGPLPTGWGSLGRAGEGDSIPRSPGSGAGATPFGSGAVLGLAGYGTGLGQLGFDRAHAATPQAMKVGAFRAPVQFRRVSGAEVLSQSEFELPLRRPAPATDAPTPVGVTEADPAAPVPPVETAPQAAAAAWTLWGRGTASGFDGKPKDDFSMDGNVFTGYLGLDYRLQPNVLLGLAVAHSRGDVDYETRDVTKGDVDLTLTSVLPYAHWSPRPGLGVWGLFGAGWGDLDLKDEAGKVGTDLEMLMGAVGARQELLTWRRVDVALKADAFLTELEAGSDDRLPKTAGDAQRLRLMVEGRTAWAISEDSHLTPIFEIGGRWDGGKAETGVGAELGGGFEYAHTKLGLGIEARGRYLLAHQKSAFDEWGASLTLRLDPGADKRGLWLALAPVWGAEASQVERMWGSADVLRAGAETDATPGLSPAQVEFDVGYGLVTHEGMGLLTTYGGVSMAGPESHGCRVGGRIELGEWVDLSVEGERSMHAGGAEHQVALYGHLGW